MRKGKKEEVTEQEKITDAVRGHEVKNKVRTKSIVGQLAINDNYASTGKADHLQKRRY